MVFTPSKLPSGMSLFPTPTYFDASQFFGRESDFTQVNQNLLSGTSIAIGGKRRIGRTWFLQYLKTHLPGDKFLVIASEDLSPNTIVPRISITFLTTLVRVIGESLRHLLIDEVALETLKVQDPDRNVSQAFRADIRRLHEVLKSINRIAVILIDEAEALYDFQDDINIIPAIVRQLALEFSHIRVVVAGYNLKSPPNVLVPFFEILEHYHLYGIGTQGAHSLIVSQLEKYNVVFESTTTVSLINELTGTEPTLLRRIAQFLTEQARINGGVIRNAQVDAATNACLSNSEFLSWVRWHWDSLGFATPVHTLLALFAHNLNDIPQDSLFEQARRLYSQQVPGTVESDVDRLCDLGFFKRDENSGNLTFSSDLLRRWIIRNRQNPGL